MFEIKMQRYGGKPIDGTLLKAFRQEELRRFYRSDCDMAVLCDFTRSPHEEVRAYRSALCDLGLDSRLHVFSRGAYVLAERIDR